MKKVYAVAKGKRPGIYFEWFGKNGAEIQIKGFSGAKYKGFVSRQQAETWLKEQSKKSVSIPEAGKFGTTIYTDGGCSRNPGPGGYGAIILKGNHRKEISGGYRLTTNNRMELMACIAGLKESDGYGVDLYSDSKYVVDSISKGWAKRWRAKGWMRNGTDKAENSDLWAVLLELCDKYSVKFHWVKGHADNPLNERCDYLAVNALKKPGLPADIVYEQTH